MRRASAIAILLAACTGLAGCATFAPYETVPLPPGRHPSPLAGLRIGICYDRIASSTAEITAAGQRACGPGTEARRIATDYDLMNCPLLLPGRATFACVPKK